MADNPTDIKHFDLSAMENFRDYEVDRAYKDAKRHREGGGEGDPRTLGDLVDGHTTADNLDQNQQLLRIGKMATDGRISGPKLLEGVREAATALDKLLGDQIDLYKELQDALTDTIEGARKTQAKNLDAIDAQTLLQHFDEVDTLTAGGSGEGESDS
ncbi:type VII secretion system-associated protein [Streptomyces sp. enrichment culture]|uniref:type VII secretion system-associated protein n=1 Tax=Streptomyces sp. enrichment culture TaxID=1795815 RepID=UPI003F569F64